MKQRMIDIGIGILVGFTIIVFINLEVRVSNMEAFLRAATKQTAPQGMVVPPIKGETK